MRLLLIRHTPPDLPAGQCYGRLDVPAQAAGLDDWLRDWDAGRQAGQPWQGFRRLLSSPARRCVVLAQALSLRLDLPVVTDLCWQEMDFGTWEGQSWDAVGRPAVDAWVADPAAYAPGGGESAQAMLQRVVTGLSAVQAAGEDTVLICHGGTIRMVQAWQAFGPGHTASPGDAHMQRVCEQAARCLAPPPGAVLMLEL